MARTIWKYLVPFAHARGKVPLAPMSWNAKPVHCGIDPQTYGVAVWVDCDSESRIMCGRELFAFPTGGVVPDGWEHWGSVIEKGYVWHVFAGPRQERPAP